MEGEEDYEEGQSPASSFSHPSLLLSVISFHNSIERKEKKRKEKKKRKKGKREPSSPPFLAPFSTNSNSSTPGLRLSPSKKKKWFQIKEYSTLNEKEKRKGKKRKRGVKNVNLLSSPLLSSPLLSSPLLSSRYR